MVDNRNPNIANEKGHTYYPKYVYPNGPKTEGVIVNSEEEEAKIMKGAKKSEADAGAPAWGAKA